MAKKWASFGKKKRSTSGRVDNFWHPWTVTIRPKRQKMWCPLFQFSTAFDNRTGRWQELQPEGGRQGRVKGGGNTSHSVRLHNYCVFAVFHTMHWVGNLAWSQLKKQCLFLEWKKGRGFQVTLQNGIKKCLLNWCKWFSLLVMIYAKSWSYVSTSNWGRLSVSSQISKDHDIFGSTDQLMRTCP